MSYLHVLLDNLSGDPQIYHTIIIYPGYSGFGFNMGMFLELRSVCILNDNISLAKALTYISLSQPPMGYDI